MNKRHGMMAVLLVALLLATSCSTFFTGSVNGRVTCNGEEVGKATVALYFDQAQRDADYAAENKTFHTQYKTETQANGQFAITNIPWDSAFPEYGKDADEQTAYMLIYHKDYGYKKIDGITIISGRNNEVFPEFDAEKTKEKTVTVKFMDLNNNVPVTGIKSFKYSYSGKPGYDEAFEETVASGNGVATFVVDYDTTTVPTITITDIVYDYYEKDVPYCRTVGDTIGNATGPIALYKEEKTYTLNLSESTELHIHTVPMVHSFEGFDGVIDTPTANPTLVNIMDKNDKVVGSVWLDKQFTDDATYTRFRGLGSGIVIRNTELPVDGADPAVMGYPAVIKTEPDAYKIQTTISTDTSADNIVLTSDRDTANVIVVDVVD